MQTLMTDVRSVPDQLSEVARIMPDSIALDSGDQQLRYHELDQRADRLAGYLAQLGVRRGDTVALCMERSFDWIVVALGIMRAGAAYVPLDTSWPDERLRLALEDSAATVLVARSALLNRLKAKPAGVDPKRDAALIAAAPEFVHAPVEPGSLAYVIYTSGSTGAPKGVEITHQNLIHLARWHREAFGIMFEDRASHLAGLGFDAAVWELWPNLCVGATICLPDDAIRLSPRLIQQWLIRDRVTISYVPTVHAASLMRMEWPADTSLRLMLTGGEVLHHSPAMRLPFDVVNNYGPTECTVVATFSVVNLGSSGRPPIGRPIAGSTIYLLDERGEHVPDGMIGEIYIGGNGVGRGYRNLPESTARCFVPDPFAGERDKRMYRTGDRGMRRPDGEIEFCGRSDRQVKIRGQRVELDEIGSVLNQHPGIEFATVITKPSESGEDQLVAYVLPKKGVSIAGVAELQKHLLLRLPDYMIPAVFMRLLALPISAGGKVDLTAIDQPRNARPLEGTVANVPVHPLAKKLLTMVQEILENNAVTVEDNFFLAGGHSLLAMQLVTRIHTMFGVELSLQQLFDAPTVESLASLVETQFNLPPEGTRQSIFWVHTLSVLLAKELGKDQPFSFVKLALDDFALLGEAPAMQDIAKCLVPKILAKQFKGPYIIGGICIASVLAYEIASQLRAAGYEVSLLLLLDAPTQPYLKSCKSLTTRVKHPRYFLHRIGQVGLRRILAGRCERVLKFCPRSIRERFPRTEHSMAHQLIENAAFAYQPDDYEGKVLLLLATERDPVFNFLPGWKLLVPSGLYAFYVKGRHRALIRPHTVRDIANIIRSHVIDSSAAIRGDGVFLRTESDAVQLNDR